MKAVIEYYSMTGNIRLILEKGPTVSFSRKGIFMRKTWDDRVAIVADKERKTFSESTIIATCVDRFGGNRSNQPEAVLRQAQFAVKK
jgi:hypothetical protein